MKKCLLILAIIFAPLTGSVQYLGGGGSFLAIGIQRAEAAVDPYYSYVSALLHMDGVNGGTTFTDRKGHAFTAVGTAITSIAQIKFGSASQLGGYVNGTTNSGYNFGTGDFTVEFWFYFTAVSPTGALLTSQPQGAGYRDYIIGFDAGQVYLYVTSAPTTYIVAGISGNSSPALNTWHHLAWVRSGTSWKIYIDGVEDTGLTFTSSSPVNYNGLDLMINTAGASNNNKYIDDLRITKGIARYTANFTPPTSAFWDDYGIYAGASKAPTYTKYKFVGGYTKFKGGAIKFNYKPRLSCTGGTITYNGGRTIHTFTASGTLTCTGSNGTADYLVVAGGGGGGGGHNDGAGGFYGGGGGGGGYFYAAGQPIIAGSYPVVVGAGGTGVALDTQGNNGNSSSFNGTTSAGGGGGGKGSATVGGNGNSVATASGGGGGGAPTFGTGGSGAGDSMGHAGGDGNAQGYGGGGGGSGSIGGIRNTVGAGTANSISGGSVTYSAGGAGSNTHIDGAVNTGTGGGATGDTGISGSGGSGIVIIRYTQ